MKVIVLMQPGDSLNRAQSIARDIENRVAPGTVVELAVETVAEDSETRLGSYEEIKKN